MILRSGFRLDLKGHLMLMILKTDLKWLSEFIKFQFSRKPDFEMNFGLMESELERLTLPGQTRSGYLNFI